MFWSLLLVNLNISSDLDHPLTIVQVIIFHTAIFVCGVCSIAFAHPLCSRYLLTLTIGQPKWWSRRPFWPSNNVDLSSRWPWKDYFLVEFDGLSIWKTLEIFGPVIAQARLALEEKSALTLSSTLTVTRLTDSTDILSFQQLLMLCDGSHEFTAVTTHTAGRARRLP